MQHARRELLTAALASAGAVAHGAGPAHAAEEDGNAQVLGDIRRELQTIRAACCEVPGEVQRIRMTQNAFLRSTSKFPDMIDVGTHYWEAIYDWLRLSPQPVEVTQLPTGRYGMRFGFTILVLRPDAPEDFLGTAQDR